MVCLSRSLAHSPLLLTHQDFLQVLSIFAAFKFQWPPLLMSLYNSVSLASFNLELLAPECTLKVNYLDKWLVTQSLPLFLLLAVGVVLVGTRLLQYIQRVVFKVLPFGALAELDLVDVCIGILISGNYYLYFRTFLAYLLCAEGAYPLGVGPGHAELLPLVCASKLTAG